MFESGKSKCPDSRGTISSRPRVLTERAGGQAVKVAVMMDVLPAIFEGTLETKVGRELVCESELPPGGPVARCTV